MHRKSYLIKNGLALYIHFGGAQILDLLNNNYSTEEAAEELFKMGDMIQLGESVEKSVFFARDQNIKMEACIPVKVEEIYTGDAENFIFENGVWNKK